ncbi:hypothetical protein PBCVNEJV1_856R [Paramecium bursaria Chlorella virus NE-JV-1]|nr:hypothetical protein PBCVNEJV1_856R [Paramecium bursaria Chlorella virus NE-JV-1]
MIDIRKNAYGIAMLLAFVVAVIFVVKSGFVKDVLTFVMSSAAMIFILYYVWIISFSGRIPGFVS